jgi:hypothetical protein
MSEKTLDLDRACNAGKPKPLTLKPGGYWISSDGKTLKLPDGTLPATVLRDDGVLCAAPAERETTEAPKSITHALTDQPVCPWCGDQHEPPIREDFDNYGEFSMRCLGCDKRFTIERQVRTTYTTAKE